LFAVILVVLCPHNAGSEDRNSRGDTAEPHPDLFVLRTYQRLSWSRSQKTGSVWISKRGGSHKIQGHDTVAQARKEEKDGYMSLLLCELVLSRLGSKIKTEQRGNADENERPSLLHVGRGTSECRWQE
jgi:hypothetical protein